MPAEPQHPAPAENKVVDLLAALEQSVNEALQRGADRGNGTLPARVQ